MNLSSNELERYDRHIRLPNFGIAGQEKLKQAKVLCIGAGGLGCAALPYLAAAGVGKLVIMDFDKVELSNLQRQVFFTRADLGKNKATTLAARLKQLNDQIEILAYEQKLTAQSAQQLFTSFTNSETDTAFTTFDLVIDASDNFATRYLINDLCSQFAKPFVSAAIDQFHGQCFLLQPDPISQPCYRCIFPEANPELGNCNQTGVLGVLPGIIGTFQAHLAICALVGQTQQYANQLFCYDGTQLCWKRINIQADSTCLNACHGAFYHKTSTSQYKHGNQIQMNPHIHASAYLTSDDLAVLIANNTSLYLLDVREPHEYQQNHFHLAFSVPLSEIKQKTGLENFFIKHKNMLQKSQLIILHCQRGPRSEQAYQILQTLGCENLKILQDGMAACLQNPKLIEFISK